MSGEVGEGRNATREMNVELKMECYKDCTSTKPKQEVSSCLGKFDKGHYRRVLSFYDKMIFDSTKKRYESANDSQAPFSPDRQTLIQMHSDMLVRRNISPLLQLSKSPFSILLVNQIEHQLP